MRPFIEPNASSLFSTVTAFLLACMPHLGRFALAQDKSIVTERGAGAGYEQVALNYTSEHSLAQGLARAKPRPIKTQPQITLFHIGTA